jgi:hypothetical protein
MNKYRTEEIIKKSILIFISIFIPYLIIFQFKYGEMITDFRGNWIWIIFILYTVVFYFLNKRFLNIIMKVIVRLKSRKEIITNITSIILFIIFNFILSFLLTHIYIIIVGIRIYIGFAQALT